MKDPKDLPLEDQPDPDFDALLEELGLMHIAEALQCDGEMTLLYEQMMMETKKHLLANVDKLANKTKEELQDIIRPIFQEHINHFTDRTNALLRSYFPEKYK